MLACLSCSLYSWWFMCFGWWGYYLEICYIMAVWRSFASSHLYKQGNPFPLVKIVLHSLLMMKSSICTYLGGSFIMYWVLIASIFLNLIAHVLLELISESSLYLVYLGWLKSFKYHFFVLSPITKKGRLKHLCPYFYFLINDDPYFWTNKFIEMVVVLVEIRKRLS
jgi:hypothetical protein